MSWGVRLHGGRIFRFSNSSDFSKINSEFEPCNMQHCAKLVNLAQNMHKNKLVWAING